MIRPPPPFKAKCHGGELSKSAAYILLWRPTFYVGVKSCLYLILNWVYSRTVKPVSGDRNSSMISPGHSGQALTPSATVGHSFGDGVRLSSHLGNRNKLSCPRHDHRIHSGFYSPIAKHFRETISLSTATAEFLGHKKIHFLVLTMFQTRPGKVVQTNRYPFTL